MNLFPDILAWIYLMCRAAANTRIGIKRVRTVRVRGGHMKHRALRLDHGTFSWASEGEQNAQTCPAVTVDFSRQALVTVTVDMTES
jgi:small subunit ribosomal protein S8e